MDDLLIYTEDQKEHQEIVSEVLKRLNDNGMAISLDKCVWEADKVEYLGYLVSEQGLLPLPKKVEAITKLQPPTRQKELLAFLGAANFWRRSLGGLKKEGVHTNAAVLI